MAKIVKLTKEEDRAQNMNEDLSNKIFEDLFNGLSSDERKVMEDMGVRSIEDLVNLIAPSDLTSEPDEEDDEYHRLPDNFFLNVGDVREYHLRIKLTGSPVSVWRELKVPSNISLELLSRFLLHAMGWEDVHLHQFRQGNTFYKSRADIEDANDLFGGFFHHANRRIYDANDCALFEVLKKKGDRMMFEYDFGDSWQHDVWVKGIREYEPDEEPVVSLVKGAGACPPEDCGGVWGYADLLEIRAKARKTKEEKERLKWFGIDDKRFDPEEYDLEYEQDILDDYWEFIQSITDKG